MSDAVPQADAAAAEAKIAPARSQLGLSLLVFLAVWITSGWYWHSRDWNTASRLMLVYALGDRGTIAIDGLHRQTGDLAFKDGHYYCDKAPGYSLIGVPAYVLGKSIFGWDDHPLGLDGFPLWPADAWIAWLTSGIAAGVIAVVVFRILVAVGTPSKSAVLAGIATVWASPLAVYATLAYGHLVASALLMTAAALTLTADLRSGRKSKPFLIGLAAGLAVLTELALAPSAVAIGLCATARASRPKAMLENALMMTLGALPAAFVLLAYNFLAFGSPFEMGYFYHATKQFAEVHSADNPLGLGRPDLSKLRPLFWGEYRGLLFYAPWVALAAPGWAMMAVHRRWSLLWLTLTGFAVPLWVNLSYPEWTGGWSTGPRLLVPTLPWLGVAAGYSLRRKCFRVLIIPASLWGWILNSLFLSVGGRISQDIARPLRDAVLPIWTEGRLPPFWPGEPFARVLPQQLMPALFGIDSPTDPRYWAVGLLVIQGLFLALILWRCTARVRNVAPNDGIPVKPLRS